MYMAIVIIVLWALSQNLVVVSPALYSQSGSTLHQPVTVEA